MSAASHRTGPSRWFYLLASLLLLVLVVWGFHFFYFQGKAYPGRDLPPPVCTLLISHGLLMSLWMLLAVAQPLLVATGKRKLHMMMGKVGAVVALLVVVTGVVTAIESVKVTPPEVVRFTLAPKPFLMVPLSAIVLFAIYIAIGVWQRKRPDIHRPMMLLGSLAAVSAGLGRITVVNAALDGTTLERWFTAFVSTAALGLILWGIKCLVDRRVDRPFGIAAGVLVIWFLVCSQFARTGLWNTIAGVLLGQ